MRFGIFPKQIHPKISLKTQNRNRRSISYTAIDRRMRCSTLPRYSRSIAIIADRSLYAKHSQITVTTIDRFDKASIGSACRSIGSYGDRSLSRLIKIQFLISFYPELQIAHNRWRWKALLTNFNLNKAPHGQINH